MIERHHRKGDAESLALYSDDDLYRYLLSRHWGPGGQVLFIMLNPSTATEVQNDPTIERCERRARMWGFGGVAIANLFGFRATLPQDLKRAADPIGPDNDAVLFGQAQSARLTICAWGIHGAHLQRGALVAESLRKRAVVLHHLGLTKAAAPRHPLYLPYDRGPQVWD